MDFRQLNQQQRKKMDSILNLAQTMEWKDPDFLDILMGKLPQIRYTGKEIAAKEEIRELKNLLASYNAFTTNKKSFLNDLDKKVAEVYAKDKYWAGINEYEVRECVYQHKFCLISGEGGIGKSFFIRKFEGELEAKKIPHLCVYGKFEKDTSNLNVQNVIENSSCGFVFVVDAINEMTEQGQQELLQLLSEMTKYPMIRIVITYRTNSLNQEILNKYQELAKSEYVFPGVSFESALELMLKLPVPDLQRYEDVLYSNNALLLSMLTTVLQDRKVTEEAEKGIASVTFILEQYIKHTASKAQKGVVGRQIWQDTKTIAHWMYEHEKTVIDRKTLLSLINEGGRYISIMTQLGFLTCFESDSEQHYYFAIEMLMNYLIARSLLQDIRGKSFSEQVAIIKCKAQKMQGLEEAITIAIFDAFSIKPGYPYIKQVLLETGLLYQASYRTFVKVYYPPEHIQDFLQVFHIEEPSRVTYFLEEFGGYTNKPFNCTNFLRNYYAQNHRNHAELSAALEGTHFHQSIINRLKNILYVVTLNKQTGRDEEGYNFALLCSAAPNKSIRCLAAKILYTLAFKDLGYQKQLVKDYELFTDYYIREVIIHVLSKADSSDADIRAFFIHLIHDEPELTAISIKRIAAYLGDEYGYINWERPNLYHYVPNASISQALNKILLRVTLQDKYALPFDYWGDGDIRSYTNFLAEDKRVIFDINRFLEKKYSCARTGICQGLSTFEAHIRQEAALYSKFPVLDAASMLHSLEPVMKYIFTSYAFTDFSADTQILENSLYMKCVSVAIGLFYGSLMCNYYTDQFVTYNSQQNGIGYEVYDPLKYGEEIHLASPIPVYQSFVEELDDITLQHIEIPEQKDESWSKDVELTRRNLISLLSPLNINGETWFLLAGRVSMHEDNKDDTMWKDTYDIWCCTSEKETIQNDGHARYLTIELREYQGNLSSYQNCEETPWLCKDVNNLSDNLNVLDSTNLVLPPAEIIDALKLSVDLSDLSWYDSNHIKAIICNNNKSSYYRDPIEGTVFIRKEFLDKYQEKHPIKFFAFAERYTKETGFADETSLHIEIQNGRIIKEVLNNQQNTFESNTAPQCDKCPFGYNPNKTVSAELPPSVQELIGFYEGISDSSVGEMELL